LRATHPDKISGKDTGIPMSEIQVCSFSCFFLYHTPPPFHEVNFVTSTTHKNTSERGKSESIQAIFFDFFFPSPVNCVMRTTHKKYLGRAMASECRFFSFFPFVPSPGIQVHFEKSATHQNAYQSEDRAIPCRNAAFFVFFPSPAIQAHFAISATHQNASLKRNIPERNFFFFRPSFLKRWFL